MTACGRCRLLLCAVAGIGIMMRGVGAGRQCDSNVTLCKVIDKKGYSMLQVVHSLFNLCTHPLWWNHEYIYGGDTQIAVVFAGYVREV